MTLALVASLGGLAAGAALALGGQRRNPSLRLAVDGLILGLVPALVLLRLLPHAWDSLGVGAIVLCAAGFLGLHLVDIASHRVAERIGNLVVLPLLVVHAVADGAALSLSAAAIGGAPLMVTLVAHRVPEGLFVAAAGERGVELRRVALRVGLLAAGTVAGALVGGRLSGHISEPMLDALVAVGLGAMLHVTVHGAGSPDHAREHAHDGDAHHHHDHAPTEPRVEARALAALCFAFGLAAALLLPGAGDLLDAAKLDELPARILMPTLFVETAPALLVAMAFAALSLHRRPLSPSAATTALMALAPIGSWIGAALLGARFLGPLAVAVAVAGAAVAALAGGALAGGATLAPRRPDRVAALATVGLRHLSGLAIVAAVEAALHPGALAGLSPATAVLLAITAGVFVATDALPAVLLAAILVHKGLRPEAAVAVIVANAAHLSRLQLVRRALGTAAAARYAGAVAVVAAAAVAVAARLSLPSLPPLHDLASHIHGDGERAAAAAAGLLIGIGLGRLGPRRALAVALGGSPQG